MFPNYDVDALVPLELGLCKALGAGMTTDACNVARKSRIILLERLQQIA